MRGSSVGVYGPEEVLLSEKEKYGVQWIIARIEQARIAYGEQIIQCTNRAPEEVEGFLMLDGEIEKARMWRAFAVAKREGNPDYIRGLLVYLLSHQLGKPDPRKRDALVHEIEQGRVRLQDLTVERLAGTRLKWDHIFRLVGREFNPTREKEFVKRIYERLTQEEEGFSTS